jgi:hypothetical protein
MAVVAAGGRGVGLMGEARPAPGGETGRRERHLGFVVGRDAATGGFAEFRW